jgi:hypothetical protein
VTIRALGVPVLRRTRCQGTTQTLGVVTSSNDASSPWTFRPSNLTFQGDFFRVFAAASGRAADACISSTCLVPLGSGLLGPRVTLVLAEFNVLRAVEKKPAQKFGRHWLEWYPRAFGDCQLGVFGATAGLLQEQRSRKAHLLHVRGVARHERHPELRMSYPSSVEKHPNSRTTSPGLGRGSYMALHRLRSVVAGWKCSQ